MTMAPVLNPVNLFGAACTLAIFSLVFKENRVYRFFEHMFIGLAVGYDVAVNWTQVLQPMWWDPMTKQGQWAWIMTVPVGLMFYGIYTKKFAWMSKLLFGVFFGLTATTVFQGFSAGFMPQVIKSFKSLYPPPAEPGDRYAALHQFSAVANNAIFMAILICVIIYFLFAFEQKHKFIQNASKAGRYILMGAFGSIFGSTIMTRMALLIDRIHFLLHDWLNFVR